MYFNYHAKAKKLIKEGHLEKYEFIKKWGNVEPALVLFFDNNIPMPIRKPHWEEYLILIETSQKKQ